MARYIDADKAIADMLFGMKGSHEQAIAIEVINDTPTADVAEVKHGEWGDTGIEELDLIYSGYKCSECGDIICGNMTNYCPNCGAKMDGGKA